MKASVVAYKLLEQGRFYFDINRKLKYILKRRKQKWEK